MKITESGQINFADENEAAEYREAFMNLVEGGMTEVMKQQAYIHNHLVIAFDEYGYSTGSNFPDREVLLMVVDQFADQLRADIDADKEAAAATPGTPANHNLTIHKGGKA